MQKKTQPIPKLLYRALWAGSLLALFLLMACQFKEGTGPMAQALQTLQVTSPAFQEGALIPVQYTCDGGDNSPPLEIAEVDKNAKSLVLIVDDPDAPMGTWTHWLVWNLPPTLKHFPENGLPNGAVQGMNSFNQLNYGGPCPPSGTHRYFFKVYALDIVLYLEPGASRPELEKEMEEHILGYGTLMGRYKRTSK